jgi:hypothetical protein
MPFSGKKIHKKNVLLYLGILPVQSFLFSDQAGYNKIKTKENQKYLRKRHIITYVIIIIAIYVTS